MQIMIVVYIMCHQKWNDCATLNRIKKMRSIVIYTSQINDCTLLFSNKNPIIIFDVLGK